CGLRQSSALAARRGAIHQWNYPPVQHSQLLMQSGIPYDRQPNQSVRRKREMERQRTQV
ncbi:hypothetical protein NPIL_307701, partial [Nephila pilipes]